MGPGSLKTNKTLHISRWTLHIQLFRINYDTKWTLEALDKQKQSTYLAHKKTGLFADVKTVGTILF